MTTTRKWTIGIVILVVLLVAIPTVVLLTRSSSGSSNVKIGLEAPLTGSLSQLGKGMLNGATMAANELNANGGIQGKHVEIIPIDDAGNATTGVKAANQAIANGLDGVVGPYNSSAGVKTLPLYIKAGLVPIRLTSDNATDSMG